MDTLRIETRCRSIDEFVARFARDVHGASIVVRTAAVRPSALRHPFVFELADGTPVLSGEAAVLDLDDHLRLDLLALDAGSRIVLDRLRGRAEVRTRPLAFVPHT